MADLTFYMKPGCKTNTRQLAALEAAGLAVEVKDLIAEPWTAARLRQYFGAKPVSAWVNPFAPRVKSGEIAVESLLPDDALDAMVDDPLLIRRPLVKTDWGRICGFDPRELAKIGISLGEQDHPSAACSSPDEPCEAPKRAEA